MTNSPSTTGKENLYCPAGVETLLWYHSRCEPIHESGVHREYTKLLLDKGCIEPITREPGYRTTAKGKVMVQMICETPFPVETFTDPRFT